VILRFQHRVASTCKSNSKVKATKLAKARVGFSTSKAKRKSEWNRQKVLFKAIHEVTRLTWRQTNSKFLIKSAQYKKTII